MLPLAVPALSIRQVAALVLVAALAIVAAVQTWRIEAEPLRLPLGLSIGVEGFRAKVARLEAEARAADAARIEANRQALAQKQRFEQDYLLLAEKADVEIDEAIGDERDRMERFIAAGGVRGARVCPGGPAATPADHGARQRAAVREAPELDGAEPLRDAGAAATAVSVLPDDVRICTTNTILAEQWRALLLDLERASKEKDDGE